MSSPYALVSTKEIHAQQGVTVMPYSHILAAVDLTEEAPEVLAKAAQVAAQHESKLSVVSVVKPLMYSYGSLAANSMAEMSVQFEREAVNYAQDELKKLVADLGVADDDVHVLLGRPSAEIKSLAEQLGVGLIVMGTHGKHGLGLLLGSTANGVVHGTTCDVLAVRVGAKESA
jgi:universal stress protein A